MNNLYRTIMFLMDLDSGGASGGTATEEAVEETAETKEPEKLGWRSTLTPEQRETELAKKFGKVPELFNYAADLDAKMKKAVLRPDSDDKEALDAFYKALGRPESPADYELPVKDGYPETDKKAIEEVKKWFSEAAHQSGLTKDQAKHMFSGYLDIVERELADFKRAHSDQREQVQKEMQKEYGDEAQALVKGMNTFVLRYAGEDFYNRLVEPNEKGEALGNDPVVAKGLVELYKLVRDDKVAIKGKAAADKNRGYVYSDMEE